MKLQTLQALIHVEELGSIRAAALEVALSQPALTAAIQQLEEELHAPLLVRTRQGATLTTFGRAFMAHARLKSLFVQDLLGGADPAYALPTRVICELAWHALFIQHLLIVPKNRDGFSPKLTVINLPSFKADPQRHGTIVLPDAR